MITRLKVQAAKENKTMSRIVEELISDYLKAHESGNPAFKLDQFIANPDMIAVPTLFGTKEQWARYLASCKLDELAKLEGSLLQKREMARQAWLDGKKNNRDKNN